MRLMAHQSMIRWSTLARGLTIAWLAFTLCGCVGGAIAHQIVQSMLLHGADRMTAAAIDAHEEKQKIAAQNMPLKDTTPDKFDIAFMSTGFSEVTPQIEALPSQEAFSEEKPVQLMVESKLIQVEVWSLLIGDEKQQFLEDAKKQGSTDLPPDNEWQQSQVAIGATGSNKLTKQEVITFLIPAEIGKLHSGSKALVEQSTAGKLSVARYAVN